MAMSAGCYQLAEHYLMSLMVHALLNQKTYMVDRVNDVRAHYQVAPFPKDMSQDGCMQPPSTHETPLDAEARSVFRSMTAAARLRTMAVSLRLLRLDHAALFRRKTGWMGIYLVARDRLDGELTQRGFYDVACGMTPEDWPERLAIGKSTMNNFARYVNYEDREEAYYDMKNNPWQDLCDTYWDILRGQLLTKCRRQTDGKDGISDGI